MDPVQHQNTRTPVGDPDLAKLVSGVAFKYGKRTDDATAAIGQLRREIPSGLVVEIFSKISAYDPWIAAHITVWQQCPEPGDLKYKLRGGPQIGDDGFLYELRKGKVFKKISYITCGEFFGNEDINPEIAEEAFRSLSDFLHSEESRKGCVWHAFLRLPGIPR